MRRRPLRGGVGWSANSSVCLDRYRNMNTLAGVISSDIIHTKSCHVTPTNMTKNYSHGMFCIGFFHSTYGFVPLRPRWWMLPPSSRSMSLRLQRRDPSHYAQQLKGMIVSGVAMSPHTSSHPKSHLSKTFWFCFLMLVDHFYTQTRDFWLPGMWTIASWTLTKRTFSIVTQFVNCALF